MNWIKRKMCKYKSRRDADGRVGVCKSVGMSMLRVSDQSSIHELLAI